VRRRRRSMTDGQPRADHIDESLRRKSFGAAYVAWALGVTAYAAPMPWWGALLVLVVALLGLHMVAGLKFKWSYPDW
jgi:hypothetical protein